jgi:hypothetical protein
MYNSVYWFILYVVATGYKMSGFSQMIYYDPYGVIST